MGFIPVIGGFDISAAQPVDARMVFTSSVALFDSSSTGPFPATRRYYGMLVYITDQSMSYTLRSGEDRSGGGVNFAEWVSGSVYALSASYAATASHFESFSSTAESASWASQSLFSYSSSWASSSLTASYIDSGSGYYDGFVFSTGSLHGTASWANSASWAPSSDTSDSASWASQSFSAESASWASSSISASHAINADTASYVLASSIIGTVISASHALMADTASYVSASSIYGTVESSSYAGTASLSFYSDSSLSSSWASSSISSSWTDTSLTASYGLRFTASNHMVVVTESNDSLGYIDLYGGHLYGTASWAESASWAIFSNTSYSSSWASHSFSSYSSSWASSSLTASYSEHAQTASYISGSILFGGKTDYYYPHWINNTLSATSSIYQSASYIGINTTNPTHPLTLVYNRTFWDSTYGINVINTSGPARIRLQSYVNPTLQTGEAAVDLYNSQSQTVGRYATTVGNGVLFGAASGDGNYSGSDGGYFVYAISSSDGYTERYFLTRKTFSPHFHSYSDLGAPINYWDIGYINHVYGTSSFAISASWAPSTDIPSSESSSWASSSISSSYSETASYVSGNFWRQGGNEWGELGYLGTTDEQEVSFIISGSELVRFTTGSGVGILTRPTDFTLQIAGAVGPSLDNTYDLGSPSLRWKNVYAANLVASGSVVSSSYAETASYVEGMVVSVESSSWASASLSSSYSDFAGTASYISGSILFSGKTDYNYPYWLNNILSATSSIIQKPNYLLVTGSGLSINGINPIFAPSSSAVLDVYGSLHVGQNFPISLWKSGSFPTIYFNALASGSETIAGRGSVDHSAANILYDPTNDNLSINISTFLNYSESQVIPSFDSKIRIWPSYFQSFTHIPFLDGLNDLGSAAYKWNNLFVNNISASYITAEKLFGTSSYALTASFALNGGGGAGTVIESGSSWNITSSWATHSISSSYSEFALTASYISGSVEFDTSTIYEMTSSNAVSASYSFTASYAENAGGGGGTSLESGSTYNITSSWAHTASIALTASIAGNSLTSSYFYSESGSGAWHIYVEPTYGDLVFDFV